MANADEPRGFVPVRTLDGSCITTARYSLAAANGAIGIGDLLVIDATGFVTGRSAASPAAGTVVGVAAAPASASSGGTILVYDNPNIVYMAQTDDGTGTATAQTCVGNNINIVDAVPVAGISRQELDENTAAVTNSLVWKILRLFPRIDNDFGQFNK